MIRKANILSFLALASFVLVSGCLTELNAQNRDPFSKPAWARKKEGGKGGGNNQTAKKPGPPADLGLPAIQQRIDYYKRVREAAAANGQPIPKVTSVLALSEMSVTGIFRTPRGYAAMVEAEPLRLSYTIYPGEKFFDGQLVAIDENRLVFRRVVKMSNGKFVSSVENKPLRRYTDSQQVQGIAPTDAQAASDTSTNSARPTAAQAVGAEPAAPIVSPLEEMNKQVPADAEKDKPKKDSKKSVKVAKSR